MVEVRRLDAARLLGDTSEVDYTHYPTVEGLELIGEGKGRGMSLHTVLAVDSAS